ncbi:MAG: hypothetical protein KJS92_04880, partial [Bacteroidetes bacterium]|nr:hypothetical protein [Bacteroidota bacterium]
MKYNPKIHHRKSIRKKGYDYAQKGLYFITICCQDRICRFGKVINGKMQLNAFGQIAHDEWMRTCKLRDNVELGEFVIMPNHMHGIIRITRRGVSHTPQYPVEHENPDFISNSNMERGCPPISDDYDHRNEMDLKNGEMGVLDFGNDDRGVLDFGNDNRGVCDTPLRSPSNTIGAMVRGYKSAVTRQIRLLGFTGKLWQRNYHEHFIRTNLAYYRISRYIRENPGNW